MSVYESLSETQQFACRVIADHARATAFAIADGILPGNEGRNYVLRKIMRRAIYHGREHLGYTDPFFFKVCDFVVDQMHEAYPELEVQREFIGKMVRLEEERFGRTLSDGLSRFKLEVKEVVSVMHRATRLIGDEIKKVVEEVGDENFNKFYDKRQTDQKLADLYKEHEEKYGSGNYYQKLSGLLLKYEIPPYLLTEIIESEPDLPLELVPFRLDYLAVYLYPRLLWNEQNNKLSIKEASLLTLIRSRQTLEPNLIISSLNSLFDGHGDLRFKSFRDFARLYDTYGLPRDLIRVGLDDKGITINEDDFSLSFDLALQELQKEGNVGQTTRKSQISPVYASVLEKVGANKFHGYDTTQFSDAKVLSILDGETALDELKEGQTGSVILDQTPFYAEAGGQVGDTGKFVSADKSLTVSDTYSPVAGLIIHKVTVDKGSIKVGDTVSATVDVQKRDATRRNHTATHLVHAALREVLGTHVKQAGSVVAPNYLRFDFTHYQPMTDAEITEIEDLVNRYILENHSVNTNIMSIEEAMRGGAMALFGEKYGSDVRVLSVGDGMFSKELCGGTHVKATGDIGSFKITSDEAIASGVRRIRAITGFDAFERFREDERLIDRSLGALKTQRDNLPNAIEKLQEELKRTRKENDELKLKIATGTIGEASSNGDEAREVAGIKVLGKIVEGLDAHGTRQLSDTLLSRMKSGVVVLGRKDDGKVSIIVRVSDDLTGKIKAGNVIKEIIPIVGGRGGGKPDMAEGGGSEPDKLAEAIDASYKVIETFLTG